MLSVLEVPIVVKIYGLMDWFIEGFNSSILKIINMISFQILNNTITIRYDL